MKKLIFILLFTIGTFVSSYATHIVSGNISYKNMSGLTYEISVITYTDLSSTAADRCEIEVDFGDGNKQMVARVNGVACSGTQNPCAHCGESILVNFKENIYTLTYTYSSSGTYKISMSDVGRTSGIVNIPNSVQVPFFLETELVIPSSTVTNNSARALSSLIAYAQQGTAFHFNFPVLDLDEDILTYELVTPKGANGIDIPGYTSFTATIDPLSGEFSWSNFPAIGMYVFAIKVSECNANNTLGYTIYELAVYVQPSAASNSFTGLSNWPTDFMGRYNTTISSNDSIELDITFSDVNASSSIEIKAIGETFINGNLATFTTINSTATSITKRFKWKPNSSNLRCAPYVISFRGESTVNQLSTSNDVTLLVFVKDNSIQNCGSICGGIVSSVQEPKEDGFSILISPNPVLDEATITIESSNQIGNFEFELFDLLGKKVRTIQVSNQNQITFYRNGLPAGVYLYRVVGNEITLGSGKIVFVD